MRFRWFFVKFLGFFVVQIDFFVKIHEFLWIFSWNSWIFSVEIGSRPVCVEFRFPGNVWWVWCLVFQWRDCYVTISSALLSFSLAKYQQPSDIAKKSFFSFWERKVKFNPNGPVVFNPNTEHTHVYLTRASVARTIRTCVGILCQLVSSSGLSVYATRMLDC